MAIPTVLIGNGFTNPPLESPFSSLQPWEESSQQELTKMDQAVLTTINRILESSGLPPWSRLCELFAGVEDNFLATFAELDHYPHRKDANYWGILHDESSGTSPVWPNAAEKYVFAYLKSDHPDFKQVLSQLSSVDCNMFIYAGKVDDNIKKHYQSDKIYFSEELLNMRNFAEQCDVVVCNGGHNIVMLMLMAGKPLLTLPLFLEQELTGRRIEAYGAGLLASAQDVNKQSGKMLRELLANETYTQKARGFAEKYRSFDSKEMLDKAASRCIDILS
jgi:UDP:flavonoid glycosyltransferase YjiC (YdhE family)